MQYEQTPTPKTDLPSVSRNFLTSESFDYNFLIKMEPSIINHMIGKYRITNRIAQGSFGEIYVGLGPNNEQVAIKYEKHGAKHPQLRHEYKVYRLMVNCPGFCTAQHFGTKDTYNFMIIDLLGPSLEELFNRCNRRFSMKTIIQLADQMLERVEALHTRHLIHRDIKPANFVIGLGSRAAQVFCVDFGLSKRYCDPKTMRHIFPRHDRSLTGTPRYASINNHLGVEQSRRDDLESVAYILIYFIRGQLPWQGLKSNKPEHKYRLILQKKQQVPIAQLCQGCPSQFAEFLAYTRALKFDATPDIPYLRKMFRDLYHALGCGQDPRFWDWDPLPGMSFCACPHCCPPGVIGLSPLPVPGGQLPPSSGMPPLQQQLPPAHSSYERADSSRSDRRDPHAPPLPPPNGAAPVQSHQRVSSSAGGVRTSTRSSSAAVQGQGQGQGHAQDPRTHAPMDQEVIDVLMNLH